MDFGLVEVFVSRLEAIGVRVSPNHRQYRLSILEILNKDNRRAEIGTVYRVYMSYRLKIEVRINPTAGGLREFIGTQQGVFSVTEKEVGNSHSKVCIELLDTF